MAWLEHKPYKAIDLIREAAKLDPDYAAPQLEVATILVHYIPDRIETALKAVQIYLNTQPDCPDGLFWLGTIQRKLLTNNAVSLQTRCTDRRPRSAYKAQN